MKGRASSKFRQWKEKTPLLSHFEKKPLASILQHYACRLTPVLIAFLIGL